MATNPPATVTSFGSRLHQALLEPDRISFFLGFALIIVGWGSISFLLHWTPIRQYFVSLVTLFVWLALIRCRP